MAESEVEMTLSYEVTRWDLLQGLGQSVLHNRLLIAFSAIPSVMVAITVPLHPYVEECSWPSKLVLAGFFSLLAAALIILVDMALFGLVVLLWKNCGVVGKHTLIIKREGLVESTNFDETLSKWTMPFKIRETSRHVFIYLNEMRFHLVPKRCFTSSEHIKSFIQELKSHTKPTA